MKRLKYNSSSIVNRLTRYILGIVILQTFLFVTILIIGGVIEEANNNAYQLFHEKASSRKNHIQLEIKNNWTNFGPYVTNIVKLLDNEEEIIDINLFFEEAISELIAMLRTTQVTGAYIILEGERSSKELPAIYLRDYDPVMNSYSNDDIYMVYGPSNLAKGLKIPLDQAWRHTFEIREENSDFIKKPYDKASITSEANLLGYWSKPFKLQEKDISIISYSIPLFDNSGIVRGIVGIEITLNYLEKYLPATELQPRDSLGYLIGYRDDSEECLSPLIMSGALQRRMIDETQPLSFEAVDTDRNIYAINNHKGKEDLFASIEKIVLYENNTPFEAEEWYLVGIMRGDYLLSYANNIKDILWISFFIALLLGTVSAGLISIELSKPIVKLANQVNESNRRKTIKLDPTGFVELDELSKAIVLANKGTLESTSKLDKIVELLGLPIGAYEINHEENTVFVTHNFYSIIAWKIDNNLTEIDDKRFRLMLEETLSSPLVDESDVYEIGEGSNKWIRLNQTKQGNVTIGVIVDVTDEILEKKQIMKERDHDPLTMLLNRKGFQSSYESWAKSRHYGQQAALIMFDMDNLKTINDTYGHKWGDHYILILVDHLRQVASESNNLVGRRSGDEFLLLLHGFETKDEIRNSMNNFYEKLEMERMEFPYGDLIPVTVSAGLMWIEDDTFTYDELLHFADEALYHAKENNKGYYVENNQMQIEYFEI